MIQPGTILNVADNSGAKKLNCITVLGGYRKATAGVVMLLLLLLENFDDKEKVEYLKYKKVRWCIVLLSVLRKNANFPQDSRTLLQRMLLY